MSDSEARGVPLRWSIAGLIVAVWIEGPLGGLPRLLLLDTGSTHVTLPSEFIERMGLDRFDASAEMWAAGAEVSRGVSLYVLSRLEVEGLPSRGNLLAVPIERERLPPGVEGLLGMNWIRTFRHVGLIHLQTDYPMLEVHLTPEDDAT